MNCVFDKSADEVPMVSPKMVQLKLQMFLGTALNAPIPKPRIERRYDQMMQERNAVSICKIVRVRARKIKYLNQKNSVTLVVKAFAEITPCASAFIVLNQEILLL